MIPVKPVRTRRSCPLACSRRIASFIAFTSPSTIPDPPSILVLPFLQSCNTEPEGSMNVAGDDPAATTPIDSPDATTISRLDGGRRVGGRYRILDEIGCGGFGRVYRAHDEVLDRVVALKMLGFDRGSSGGTGQLDALLQEARTIARLDHVSIVPVYDTGVDADLPWIVMRLVEGESLATRIRRETGLSLAQITGILRTVTEALDHAHRRGIVHRDLKPSNILLEERESLRAYLADFGIAKVLSGRTTSSESHIAGTPSYMAPEQITGRRVDARTDIFALGCVAFEMATRRRAFPGDSLGEVIYKIVHSQPEALDQIGRDLSPGLETVIRRALAKSPEDRFQTAEEMGRALDDTRTAKAQRRPRLLPSLLSRRPAEPWDGRDVVVAEDVSKRYTIRKKRNALDGFSLVVPRGSIFALLGRNGAGKTTLIRSLVGLVRPDRGSVKVFGLDPATQGPKALARIGYVPESLNAWEHVTVGELLDFLRLCYPKWDNVYCHQLLARYDLPTDMKLRDLSRGMKTKVSLVSALARRPDFLLLDDPTIGLDAVMLDEFFETLREVSAQEGTTVLIASHNIPEVESVATQVGFMQNGRMILSDTIEGLKMRTREVRMTFADDAPSLPEIRYFKPIRSSGRHLTGFVFDRSSGAIERLKELQPQEIEVRELTLREIFVNFMR